MMDQLREAMRAEGEAMQVEQRRRARAHLTAEQPLLSPIERIMLNAIEIPANANPVAMARAIVAELRRSAPLG